MILSPATMNRSGSLRPSAQRARLRQVCLDSFVPVVRSTSRKLGRLSPLDLRVKGFNSRRNIVPVECGVCFSESLHLNRKGWNQRVHVSLPPPVVTSALKKRCNGDANNQPRASRRLSCRDCINQPYFRLCSSGRRNLHV